MPFLGFVDSFFKQPFSLKGFWVNHCPFQEKFFLSFGDSFLFILQNYNISGQQEYALLPELYCPDTTKFISQYLKIAFYKINRDFSIDQESYFGQIKNLKPRVIVNYSFTGFSLDAPGLTKLKELTDDSTIIIEDYAHRILNYQNLIFLRPRHFYIDSIRKNSLFLGSHLVSQKMKFKASMQWLNGYKIKCQLLQWLRNFFDFFAWLFKSEKIYSLSGIFFEYQDEIIGNYSKPTAGCFFSYFCYRFLNREKLRSRRKQLVELYQKHLGQIKNSLIEILPAEKIKVAEMNYFPVIVDSIIKEPLIEYLGERSMFVEVLWDLDESVSKQLGVSHYFYGRLLILPLTMVVREKEIEFLSQQINNFLASYKN